MPAPTIFQRAAANESSDPTSNPLLDPDNHFGYIPSISLALLGIALYLLVTISLTAHMAKRGGRYMIGTLIGGYAYAFGLAVRIPLHWNPDNLHTYLVMTLAVSLAPTGFIASTYMLLGRLSVRIQCAHRLLIRANRVTMVFVVSDIVTFIIQALGAGVAVESSGSTARFAKHVFQAGLILQFVSFVFFTVIFTHFIFRVYSSERAVWYEGKGKFILDDWRVTALSILFSTFAILIRNLYRVLQSSASDASDLNIKEGFFYGFDALPLLIGIAIYIPFWPGRVIPDGLSLKNVAMYENASQNMSTVGLTKATMPDPS